MGGHKWGGFETEAANGKEPATLKQFTYKMSETCADGSALLVAEVGVLFYHDIDS